MARARASSGLLVAAVAYPVLLLFIFASSSSPLNANPSWRLAAEHGELAAEQWSQFLGAVVAALPLTVAFRFAPRKVGLVVVLLSSLSVALLYAVQPTHQFNSNDGWLANFTWQVAAAGVALAPMLLVGLTEALAWLHRRASQNVA